LRRYENPKRTYDLRCNDSLMSILI